MWCGSRGQARARSLLKFCTLFWDTVPSLWAYGNTASRRDFNIIQHAFVRPTSFPAPSQCTICLLMRFFLIESKRWVCWKICPRLIHSYGRFVADKHPDWACGVVGPVGTVPGHQWRGFRRIRNGLGCVEIYIVVRQRDNFFGKK
jgi:hypothetical protein